jgi:hypothetical protein
MKMEAQDITKLGVKVVKSTRLFGATNSYSTAFIHWLNLARRSKSGFERR